MSDHEPGVITTGGKKVESEVSQLIKYLIILLIMEILLFEGY